MMNRINLYETTVNKLLDAYNNGTLKHGDCNHCAVGNICNSDAWNALFYTELKNNKYYKIRGLFKTPIRIDLAKEAIETSGYTQKELEKIEWAFETAIKPQERKYYIVDNIKEGQYLGLVAVLDVLRDIHKAEPVISDNSMIRLNEAYNELCV